MITTWSGLITNSMWPLHDLSHSKIILRKAWFPYQHMHVILKTWPPTPKSQTSLSDMVCNKTSEHPSPDQLAAFMISSTVMPDIAAIVAAAILVE